MGTAAYVTLVVLLRVLEDELRQAVRNSGYGGLQRVAAVVLESDGSLGMIPAEKAGRGSALDGVAGWRVLG